MAVARPWSAEVNAVLRGHNVDQKKGLTSAQAAKLALEYGPNELDKEEATPLWKVRARSLSPRAD